MTLLALTVLIGVSTALYLATCAAWPYKTCRACGGTGLVTARLLFTHGARPCPACQATGLRRRSGHTALAALQRHRQQRRNRNR